MNSLTRLRLFDDGQLSRNDAGYSFSCRCGWRSGLLPTVADVHDAIDQHFDVAHDEVPRVDAAEPERFEVTFTLTPPEAIELFTVLRIHRDHLFESAGRPAQIRDALTFDQLVVRLTKAYAHARVVTETKRS